jgi:hypothetical protein
MSGAPTFEYPADGVVLPFLHPTTAFSLSVNPPEQHFLKSSIDFGKAFGDVEVSPDDFGAGFEARIRWADLSTVTAMPLVPQRP